MWFTDQPCDVALTNFRLCFVHALHYFEGKCAPSEYCRLTLWELIKWMVVVVMECAAEWENVQSTTKCCKVSLVHISEMGVMGKIYDSMGGC